MYKTSLLVITLLLLTPSPLSASINKDWESEVSKSQKVYLEVDKIYQLGINKSFSPEHLKFTKTLKKCKKTILALQKSLKTFKHKLPSNKKEEYKRMQLGLEYTLDRITNLRNRLNALKKTSQGNSTTQQKNNSSWTPATNRLLREINNIKIAIQRNRSPYHALELFEKKLNQHISDYPQQPKNETHDLRLLLIAQQRVLGKNKEALRNLELILKEIKKRKRKGKLG